VKAKRKRSRQREPVKAQPQPAAQPSTPADDLTPAEKAFVAAYNRHLGNGTRAWMELHPDCTRKSAGEQASALISRNLKVRAAIEAGREERAKRLTISGDGVLALVVQDATVDIADFFDDDGKLLAPHLWPDNARQSVESVDYSLGKIKLVSKAVARRTLLEQTGKLKTIPDAIDSLAEALRQDLETHAGTK